MILVDSNIPMYLIGAAHPNKERSRTLLEELVRAQCKLVCDSEVLQEICHRYQAINRLDLIQVTFDALYGVIDEVLPVTEQDVLSGKDILLSYPGLSARDALHLGVMKNLGIREILSFDKDYDRIDWVKRRG